LGGRTRNWEGEAKIGRANLLVSQILIYPIIDHKNGLVAGVREKRLTGRFALPNKKNDIYIFNIFGGFRGRSQNWVGEAKIGWAKLLVSQILMYPIIDHKNGLAASVREKRLTGRFALLYRINRYVEY
jgi:hypothetical protein